MKENKHNLIVRLAAWVTLVVALLFVAQTGQSQVVFDNTQNSTATLDPYLNPGTVYLSDTNEFGDDVLLSPAVGCVLTNFAIQTFVSTNLLATGATMRLKIYANDGTNYGVPGGTNLSYAYYVPKTLLYDSGSMALKGGTGTQILTNGPTHTFTFNKTSANFDVYVPSNFTWTVSFSGLGSATAGLVQYDTTNSPLTGSDYIGFWQNSGGAWTYNEATNGVPINFGMVATKAVIVAGAAPALTVTKVTAAFKTYTAAVAVNGTAKANGDSNNRIALVSVGVGATPAAAWASTPIVLSVAWGGTLAGPQSWVGTIPNIGPAGAVTTIFTATDAAGVSTSKTNSGTFIVTNEPLNVVINSDQGTETATVKLSSTPVTTLLASTSVPGLQIGKAYNLSITEPLTGNYFLSDVSNSVSLTVSNRANSILKLPYAYNFIMQSNLTLTVNFVTNRFFDVAGTFNGLFSVGGTPTISNAGWVTVTLNGKTRAFTGKASIDGDSGVGFNGTFGLDGTASGIISRSKLSKSNLAFTLALPFDGSDTVTGTIADGTNWTASVLADRQLSSGTDFNSRYTMVIPGNETTSTATTPGGDSAAAVLITNTATAYGEVTFDGYFGDDGAQLLKQTTYASKTGRIGLFAPGYKVSNNAKGFVWGWLTAANNTSPALTGTATWLKAAGGGTAYPAGFDFGDQGIIASVYNAPSGAAPAYSGAVIGLAGLNGTAPTNTPAITTYGELLYGGADFGTEQSISSIYENTLKATIVLNNGVTTSSATFAESAKDGKFSISVTPLGGSKHSFNGVALQSLKEARGAFNGNPLSGQSGYFIVK